MSLKIAILLPRIQLAGGILVVLEHARHLAVEHDFDVTVIVTADRRVESLPSYAEGLVVVPMRQLDGNPFDIAIATWWETVYSLPNVAASRYAYFLQSMEDRFYDVTQPGLRAKAGLTHVLPLTFITTSRWIKDQLALLHPTAPCFYVRPGIAKEIFAPRNEVDVALDSPLRIVMEGDVRWWLKGMSDAINAVRLMSEPRHVTLVTARAPEATDLNGIDDVHVGLTQREVAAHFAASEVILKLSRVEGLSAPPLEAFHMGATAILTPVTGHEEYAIHGWNALLVGFDDLRGTARALDLISRNRRLLHFLRVNALETARAWPDTRQASALLAATLQVIHSGDDFPAAATTQASILAIQYAFEEIEANTVAPLPPSDRRALQVGRALQRLYAQRWFAPARPALRRALRHIVK